MKSSSLGYEGSTRWKDPTEGIPSMLPQPICRWVRNSRGLLACPTCHKHGRGGERAGEELLDASRVGAG